MHFLPDVTLFNPSNISLKKTLQVLTVAFTGYKDRFFDNIQNKSHSFIFAILPNPEYPNYYYHADTYITVEQYYNCATNLSGKAIYLFQKFVMRGCIKGVYHKVDRIVTYFGCF